MRDGTALWLGTSQSRGCRLMNVSVPLLSDDCKCLMNWGKSFSYSIKQLCNTDMVRINHMDAYINED